jgi:hypothetical protein
MKFPFIAIWLLADHCPSTTGFGSLRGGSPGRPLEPSAIDGLPSEEHAELSASELYVEFLPVLNCAARSVLTFDYQFIADPAYNADRGPVSFYAPRFHAEF